MVVAEWTTKLKSTAKFMRNHLEAQKKPHTQKVSLETCCSAYPNLTKVLFLLIAVNTAPSTLTCIFIASALAVVVVVVVVMAVVVGVVVVVVVVVVIILILV